MNCESKGSRWTLRRRRIEPGIAGAAIFTQSASLLYLLVSRVRKTLSSSNLELCPPSSSSASNGAPKRLLESNVMVANGTPLKDMSSSASVVRKLERTLGSLRRTFRMLDETSWRRIMSGILGPFKMRSRMSSERVTRLDRYAWIFQDVRESVCLQTA